MLRILLCLCGLAWSISAQNAAFPLESVTLEGTSLSKDFVMELAGLKIGAPVDKNAIEASCARLQETGIFQSINYRYAPGPKGYALTLSVADQGLLQDAAIDIPGVDEAEIWKWVLSRYPAFNRKVPPNEAAQQFLAKKIEEHLGTQISGHLAARMESDLVKRTTLVSFQQEKLPRIAAMNFTGGSELSAAQLVAIMQKVTGEDGYTDRRFRQTLELNVRRAYEEHGMYRMKFVNVAATKADEASAGPAVAVAIAVEEGPKYTLGDVQFVGENLPVAAMIDEAKFKKGQVANWTEIQNGVWALERPVKRSGYYDASALAERMFHDNTHVLDLKISFRMGSLYRFGEVRFTGLSAAQEAAARRVWKLKPGDPYDYDYPRDFFPEFFHAVDGRQFKSYKVTTERHPDNRMDFVLAFEAR